MNEGGKPQKQNGTSFWGKKREQEKKKRKKGGFHHQTESTCSKETDRRR